MDTVVRDEHGALVFQRRGAFLAGFGVGILALGALVYGVGGVPGVGDVVPTSLLLWLGWALGVLGAVNIVVGAQRALSPPARLDSRTRRLDVEGRQVPFADLGAVRITEVTVGSTKSVALVVETAAGPIRLLDGQLVGERRAIERIAARVRERLGAPVEVAPALESSPRRSSPLMSSPRGFQGLFLLVLGVGWATTGAWLAPDLLFAYPDAAFGFRVWPFGIGLAALGIAELFGAPALRTFLGPWNRARVALFVVGMGGYAAASFSWLGRVG